MTTFRIFSGLLMLLGSLCMALSLRAVLLSVHRPWLKRSLVCGCAAASLSMSLYGLDLLTGMTMPRWIFWVFRDVFAASAITFWLASVGILNGHNK